MTRRFDDDVEEQWRHFVKTGDDVLAEVATLALDEIEALRKELAITKERLQSIDDNITSTSVPMQMAGYAIRDGMNGEFPICTLALVAAIKEYVRYAKEPISPRSFKG